MRASGSNLSMKVRSCGGMGLGSKTAQRITALADESTEKLMAPWGIVVLPLPPDKVSR